MACMQIPTAMVARIACGYVGCGALIRCTRAARACGTRSHGYANGPILPWSSSIVFFRGSDNESERIGTTMPAEIQPAFKRYLNRRWRDSDCEVDRMAGLASSEPNERGRRNAGWTEERSLPEGRTPGYIDLLSGLNSHARADDSNSEANARKQNRSRQGFRPGILLQARCFARGRGSG